jgi:hypothetical protein
MAGQLATKTLVLTPWDVNLEQAQKYLSVQRRTRSFKLSMFTQLRENRVSYSRFHNSSQGKKFVQGPCQRSFKDFDSQGWELTQD